MTKETFVHSGIAQQSATHESTSTKRKNHDLSASQDDSDSSFLSYQPDRENPKKKPKPGRYKGRAKKPPDQIKEASVNLRSSRSNLSISQ